MGGVVNAVGKFTGIGGAGVSDKAADPSLGNSGNLNWNLQSQIDAKNNTPYAQFLAQQTAGMQPSIAQAQLKQATDQNIASQMAMAASAHGPNAGTAQRMALQNSALSGQQMAQQSEILAAQEGQANAQNALAYQGQNNQFAQYLYGLGNQRDMGLMEGQIKGGLGTAEANQKAYDRGMKMFGGMGQAGMTMAGI